jgi:hypothetical protein
MPHRDMDGSHALGICYQKHFAGFDAVGTVGWQGHTTHDISWDRDISWAVVGADALTRGTVAE